MALAQQGQQKICGGVDGSDGYLIDIAWVTFDYGDSDNDGDDQSSREPGGQKVG